ncbi:MAG TPA: DUF5615 family PIN-like protein [Thermoanaerobaculia bacterium]|jgi:hypothetical protein
MRVLLDENLPRALTRLFEPNVEAATIGQVGWKGIKNGALLRKAETEFDALITMNKGIPHQQNLNQVTIGIVLLEAYSNRYEDLAPLMGQVNRALRTLQPGEIARVSA